MANRRFGLSEHWWRRKLITTIESEKRHHQLSKLLSGKPHYTLDFRFATTFAVRNGAYTSPLGAAIDAHCTTCLVTLINAGASLNYDRIIGCKALTYIVDGYGHRYNSNVWVRNMLNTLITLGADIDAESEIDGVFEHVLRPLTNAVLPPLTNAAYHGYASIAQMLLDNGALITQAAWQRAVGIYRNPVLHIFLEHADKHKQVIPLHALFERLATVWKSRPGARMPAENLQLILSRGYIPNTKSALTRQIFLQALRQNFPEADKVAFMMVDKAPMMPQACRRSLQGVTLSPHFQSLLTTPPSLQKLCQGVIVSTIGHGYCDKLKPLGLLLPAAIIKELATVKDTA